MIINEMTSAAMQQRLDELIATRSDVETLYYLAGRERMLEWMHSVATATEPGVRDLAPPTPPLALRSIVAAPSEPVFLWTGLKDAEMCVEYLDRHLEPAEGRRVSVLDFGCGCGRTTRFLQEMPRLDVHGSDVNAALVRWCQENLTHAKTSLNAVDPLLPYAQAQFDFIFSLSIFSHLSEPSMHRWLVELARVTSDGGIVLLTTHGTTALRTICGSAQHREMFRMGPAVVEDLLARFGEVRFRHFPYDSEVMEIASAGSDYGNAFIHEDYIRSEWTAAEFELVEFVEGGLRGWQDVTVLRRRPRI